MHRTVVHRGVLRSGAMARGRQLTAKTSSHNSYDPFIIQSCTEEEMDDIVSSSRSLLQEIGNYNENCVLRFSEERLRGLAMQRGALASVGVLFLCGHNAGRSQMAQFLAQDAAHKAGHDLTSFSGGSKPGTAVNPAALEAMLEVGVDMRPSAFPKPWTPEVASSVACVVTMGCGDQCPVIPGTRVLDWELPDPHGQGLDMVREVRDEISLRVDVMLREIFETS